MDPQLPKKRELDLEHSDGPRRDRDNPHDSSSVLLSVTEPETLKMYLSS